ncbi:MAG TPA: VOC family protein [Chitinophagaceae bacterium]|nr:VOC family protein [Chitinophagaceae bacterium]
MKIEHIAFWANDIETLKGFYTTYFNMRCNDKYTNTKKQFESYFLSFDDNSTRIELMQRTGIGGDNTTGHIIGPAHIAISTGSREAVDRLTARLKNDGYIIAGEPRVTGDGYYESVVLDPEGNHIEITV